MMNNLRKVAAGLVALLALCLWSQAGSSQNKPGRAAVDSSVGRDKGKPQGPPANNEVMSAREKPVRDVYARLMRYQSAGVDERLGGTDKAGAPDDYLTFELRDIRTGSVADILERPLAELVTAAGKNVIRLRQVHLGGKDAPPHAYYDAEWAVAPRGGERPDAVVRDVPGIAAFDGYTSYRVRASFQGKMVSYRALALHRATEKQRPETKSKQPAAPSRVEIIDHVTTDMNTVFSDVSPRVRAPWQKYVKSSLYLAVAREMREAASAGLPPRPADAPIGYLPGDNTQPNKEDQLTLETNAVCAAGVGKLQYQSGGGFVDVTGTLYVLKGTSVTFRAIPDPPTATFPSGQPVWSGTSGATGTGDTVSVTFNTVSANTTDAKTVTATSGNSVTANVIIYELTPTTTPQDNFSGRSTTDYGLKEIVDLAFTASPSVTAAQAGGLNWSKKSGVGTVTATAGDVGTGTYDAGASAGAVTLSLKVVSGPSQGQERTVDRNVVAPSDAVMSQTAGTGIRHVQHHIHVGFKGTIRLRPTNVSFANIHFQEGGGTAVASGCWAFENGRAHAPTGVAISIGGCNSTTGCVVNGTDTVECAAIGPYPAPPPTPAYCTGDFVWPIQWQYSTNSGTSWTTFTTANHHHWADAGANLGRANIEKKGAGPFSKHATDPTSNY